VEFGLATSSTILRYRGVHPDQQAWALAWIESVAGVALGTAAYKLSGGGLQPFWRKQGWASIAGAGIGTGIGMVVGWAVHFADPPATSAMLQISPFVAGAPGVSLGGTW
jgi:hypothetical protein